MNREGPVRWGRQGHRQRRGRKHRKQTNQAYQAKRRSWRLFHNRLHVSNFRAHKNSIFGALHGPTKEAWTVVPPCSPRDVGGVCRVNSSFRDMRREQRWHVDLFFAPEGEGITHVAMSTGGMGIIHCSATHGMVMEDDLSAEGALERLLRESNVTATTRYGSDGLRRS